MRFELRERKVYGAGCRSGCGGASRGKVRQGHAGVHCFLDYMLDGLCQTGQVRIENEDRPSQKSASHIDSLKTKLKKEDIQEKEEGKEKLTSHAPHQPYPHK